LVRSVWFTRFI